MDSADRKKLINRIITGYVPVIFLDKLYYIYDSNPESEYIAEYYAQKDLEEVDYIDAIEQRAILENKNIWTSKLEKELENLEKDQERIQKNIPLLKFKSYEKDRMEKMLFYNRKRCAELVKQRESISYYTREYFEKISKYRYLIFVNTYYNNKRVWNNIEEFENNTDNSIINTLIQKVYFNTEFNESVIRELARTDPWRTIWKASSNGNPLFNHSTSSMTEYQKAIVSWSLLYDNVYESMDCPDESIINNDAELDSWLLEQSEKRKREKKTKALDNMAGNHAEVGIFVDSYEDAQKVYELNSPDIRQKLESREKHLLAKGTVEEQHFADSQQKLKMMKNRK